MPQRISRMPWVFLALIFSITTSAHAEEPRSQSASASCPMKKLASLQVHINEQGQTLVPVNIAGHDAWMALRLDQGLLALFGAAIADWHLNLIPMNNGGRRITMNDQPLTQMVREDFRLGTQGFQNWPFVIYPAGDNPAVYSFEGKPLVGQLSTRFLTAVDAELNLAQNNITLFEHTKCAGGAVYWGGEITSVHLAFDDAGLLHFPMQLEDQEIQTSFDTSDRSSRITTEATRKFFGFDAQSSGVQSEFLDNGMQSHTYRAMSLTAKGLQIKDAKVTLWQTDKCRPDRSLSKIDGIGCTYYFGITPFAIGTDLLRQLHVYIATQEKMIYFTRADSTAPASQ
jgi:hypothetical protein